MTLGDVAKWGSGGTPKARDPRYYENGTVPWAVIGDLNDGIVRETAAAITIDALNESSAKLIPRGSILVAMYGSIGKLGIAASEMASNQAIAFAVPNDELICSKFLFWYLRSQRAELTSAGKGATQQNISQTILKSWPIPVPPLDEQRRIVATLEDHLSRLDAGVGYVQRAGAGISSIASSWLTDRLRRCSSVEYQLAEVLAEPLANGKSVPSREGGPPVLRLTAIRGGGVLLEEQKGGDWTADEAANFRVAGRDMLIVRGNGTLSLVGRCGLVEPDPAPVAFPDTMIRARTNPEVVLPEFLNLVWDSTGVRRQIEAIAQTTAGIYKVNQANLKRVVVPVPPIENQERVVVEAAQVQESLVRATAQLRSGSRRASKLRVGVLSAAFAGEL